MSRVWGTEAAHMDAGAIDKVIMKGRSPWGLAESRRRLLKFNQVWIWGFKTKGRRFQPTSAL